MRGDINARLNMKHHQGNGGAEEARGKIVHGRQESQDGTGGRGRERVKEGTHNTFAEKPKGNSKRHRVVYNILT